MDELRIRAATAADVPAIADIVDQAYRHYIARMGKPPGPMLDDYAARVSEGTVWVLEERAVIAAIIVLLPAPNYLLLDNIAVSPARQGFGLGRRLHPESANMTKSAPSHLTQFITSSELPGPVGVFRTKAVLEAFTRSPTQYF